MSSKFHPLVLAATLAITLAPLAVADTQDDQYLGALAAQGITGDPGQLIAEGHTACDHYGTAAMTFDAIALMGTGLSNTQAGALITTGLRVYCPEKLGPPPPGLPPLPGLPPG